MAVKIFLMVYEDVEVLQLNINCLKIMSNISNEDIVIVDMGIDRRIKAWLEGQDGYDYICAGGLENFAQILNTAISEFSTDENIMLLNSNLFCLGNCIFQFEKICIENPDIGAVMPVGFASVYPERVDIAEALDIVSERTDKIEILWAIKMSYDCVFIRREFINDIGQMDEELLLPTNIMLDYSFRGLCKKWKFISISNVFVYEYFSQMDVYTVFLGENVDRNRLKEKWGMNYFNEVPNEKLIEEIKREKNEVFTVLEVGCDCGVNLMQIKNRFPNAKLYGMEINSIACNIACNFGDVICGNIEEHDRSFLREPFDYILFGDVLEHLRDPEGVIIHCKHFLKPEGKIIASIPNLMHYTVLRALVNGDFTYQDSGLLDRTHVHFFTYNEIVRMFLRAGYQLDACSYTFLSDITKEDKQFVIDIKNSSNCDTFMFLAYQYLVVASMVDEKAAEVFVPQFRSNEETICLIVEEKKSLGRFGDGEFAIAFDIPRQKFQKTDSRLRNRIKEVIMQADNPDMLIGVANNYGDLECYNAQAKCAIEGYMTEEIRKQHMSLLSHDAVYSDAYITRPYVIYKDVFTDAPQKRFENLKRIWNGKHIIIVEGALTRLGVGNDLFANTMSVKRILAPATNSFDRYDDIFSKCTECRTQADLFLLAIGPSSGVLAYDLSKQGIQAVDVGHIDLEYEWFRAGKGVRVTVPGKYNNEVIGGDSVCSDSLPEQYYKEIIADFSGLNMSNSKGK